MTVAMDKSLVFQLDLSKSYFTGQLVNNSSSSQPPIRVVGWELNERGKPGPRIADLSRTLDPRSLMNQAVDLNISLMKWRLWPELNTNTVSSTKCLLFGAGTLGCAVSKHHDEYKVHVYMEDSFLHCFSEIYIRIMSL